MKTIRTIRSDGYRRFLGLKRFELGGNAGLL